MNAILDNLRNPAGKSVMLGAIQSSKPAFAPPAAPVQHSILAKALMDMDSARKTMSKGDLIRELSPVTAVNRYLAKYR
jgi:hypothetical protein